MRHRAPLPGCPGLTADQVALSRQRFGSNRLTPLPREPIWKKFLAKFDEPIIKILLAAALLSMFVDLFQHRAGLAGAWDLATVGARRTSRRCSAASPRCYEKTRPRE